jgi:hypothetical protein
LAQNQLWISVPSRATKVLDQTTFQPREMTPKEYYDFMERSGKQIKEQIGDLKDVIDSMETQELKQALIDKIVQKQREAAKAIIESGL